MKVFGVRKRIGMKGHGVRVGIWNCHASTPLLSMINDSFMFWGLEGVTQHG